MSVNLPELEGTETAITLSGRARKRSRIPGVDAMRATAGFRPGMLVPRLGVVLFFAVLAVFAPWIAPYGSNDARTADGKVFGRLIAPSSQNCFGTTAGGEDVFSRVVWGAQTALEVILLAVSI